jgi:glyoxylase-like metal-dependent hydrolase (beta-lactamase superfamily II)
MNYGSGAARVQTLGPSGYDWILTRSIDNTMQEQAGIPVPLGAFKVPVQRILGRNPGPMTGPGTNSYLVGDKELSLIDPGPISLEQLDSFLAALGGRQLHYIFCTHTHGDHSPAAMPLAEKTGATLVGLKAPDAMGQDHSFEPSRQWHHGDVVELDGYSLQCIHTPGHVSNHFCYLLREEGLLFTGDHVLQGTTPVILPPDGDMADYLSSLRLVQSLGVNFLAPGHGGLMENPHQEIEQLLQHRLQREAKVIAGLRQLQESGLDDLVVVVYDDVPQHLIPWAKKTLLAHLLKLEKEGRAQQSAERWRAQP